MKLAAWHDGRSRSGRPCGRRDHAAHLSKPPGRGPGHQLVRVLLEALAPRRLTVEVEQGLGLFRRPEALTDEVEIDTAVTAAVVLDLVLTTKHRPRLQDES